MAFVYAPGEFEKIKFEYSNGSTVESLAQKYEKSVASIRMKLVKAGVYIKKTATAEKTDSNMFEIMFNKYGPGIV